MANDTYTNPFGALPNPSNYNVSTPYGSFPTALGYQAGNTQLNSAMPSIDMALQGQGMGLQKQATELSEFKGPEQTEARRQKSLADARKSMYEGADAEMKQRLIPATEKKQRAELDQQYNEIIAKPEGQFVQSLAHSYPGMKDRSPMEQAMLHRNMVEQWQRANPGRQLPPGLANFGADTMKVAQAGYLAELHKAENEQALTLEREKGDTQKKVAGIQAGAGIAEARIREEGADTRQKRELEFGRNRVNNLRDRFLNPKTPDSERETAKRELMDTHAPEVTKATTARFQSNVNNMTLPQGEQSEIYDQIYQDEMNKRLFGSDYKTKMTSAASRIKARKSGSIAEYRQAMPGHSDAEIRAYAKEQGWQVTD